jgi:hypothetical protein
MVEEMRSDWRTPGRNWCRIEFQSKFSVKSSSTCSGETESEHEMELSSRKRRDGRRGLDATHIHRADVDPTVDKVVPELDLLLSPLRVKDVAGEVESLLPRPSSDRLMVEELVFGRWGEGEEGGGGDGSGDVGKKARRERSG